MSFINSQEKEIVCKVAYYGSAFAGKTTSLRSIYEKMSNGQKATLPSLSEEDGSLFFDFLPLSLGKVNGHVIRFHLYTVPADLIHQNSRKIILKGLDGLIFVVDSQVEKIESSLESWKGLKKNLKAAGLDFLKIPLALQYNKRDLPHILPASDLHERFHERVLPEFETVAKKGQNVMECFQAVAKQVLRELK